MADAHDIIIRPVISERSYDLMEDNRYTFEVAKNAGKIEIAKAVEQLFDVHVVKVNTMSVKRKPKRVRQQIGYTRSLKKAIVTLAEGDSIDFYQS